jgi:hypothetical protein
LLGLQPRLRRQPAGEEQEELVCCAQVASEQVGEDTARSVERGGVGVVGCVPGVLEVGEGFGGVFCAEDKVALCIVGLEICI